MHKSLTILFSLVCVLKIDQIFVLTNASEDNDWWKHTIVYQIYPRSFQDSDGDGVGDLKGIISRLDHFNYLNIGTIWLSPIYQSPMVDHGYDVSDFKDIDPEFGTMEDFDRLIDEAHRKGIRIVMDFIPNHTSDQHRFFLGSSEGGKDNPYSDYYIWHDGKLLEDGTREPPNNWLSVFGGSVWTWNPIRNQYYLHQFTVEQPDLNYRNPNVRNEMKSVLRFWLDKGVDGFRVDAITTLFENENFQDEPRSFKDNILSNNPDYLDPIYTKDQPEIHDVIREWRNLFDEHDRIHNKHTFMVMEVYDPELKESMRYYDSGSDMPFNFGLVSINQSCCGICIRELVESWMDLMPDGKWPNFVLGNHDRLRITSRKGLRYIDAMNVLLLTLPGTPTTYYGEEIGMNDIEVSFEETQDPWGKNYGPELYKSVSRDPCRSPMQWNVDVNGGFSNSQKPWLPVHPDYKTRNVQAQMLQKEISHLEIYRRLANIRQLEGFLNSHMTFVLTNENIVSYLRYNKNNHGYGRYAYLVSINVGNKVSTDNYVTRGRHQGKILLDTETRKFDGTIISLENVTVKPGQAFVFEIIDSEKLEL